jgi:hypothetical protein
MVVGLSQDSSCFQDSLATARIPTIEAKLLQHKYVSFRSTVLYPVSELKLFTVRRCDFAILFASAESYFYEIESYVNTTAGKLTFLIIL